MRTPVSDLAPPDRTQLAVDYGRLINYARSDAVPDSTEQLAPIDVMGALVLRDENGNPIDMAELHRSWTWFIHYAWSNNYYAGILSPWRHGKSTLGTTRYALDEMGRNPETRIRLLTADDRESMLRTRSIARYVSHSPEYKLIYPHVKPDRLANWNEHRFFIERNSFAPDPTLQAAAAFSTEAGGGNDLILIDDIVTFQNSILHPALREKIHQALTSVWLRRVQPSTRVALFGTTWHDQDAHTVMRRIKTGKWLWLVQRISGSGSHDIENIESEVEEG